MWLLLTSSQNGYTRMMELYLFGVPKQQDQRVFRVLSFLLKTYSWNISESYIKINYKSLGKWIRIQF